MVCAFTGNREPDEADVFDVAAEREAKPLTFGAGIHYCLGANLARAELQEALAFLAPRWKRIELDGEPVMGSINGIYGIDALPIRWTATMATMVALNLAIALRGLSDRWTHGLGPMARDERVVAMLLSWWLVLVGFAALRILVQPSLGFYGATRRLEEISTRRLALGTTVAVAMVGSVAGLLPGGLPA